MIVKMQIARGIINRLAGAPDARLIELSLRAVYINHEEYCE